MESLNDEQAQDEARTGSGKKNNSFASSIANEMELRRLFREKSRGGFEKRSCPSTCERGRIEVRRNQSNLRNALVCYTNGSRKESRRISRLIACSGCMRCARRVTAPYLVMEYSLTMLQDAIQRDCPLEFVFTWQNCANHFFGYTDTWA